MQLVFWFGLKENKGKIFVEDICYSFKCDTTLNLVFVFSILIILSVQFIATYFWNAIKMETKRNLSKVEMVGGKGNYQK